MSNQTVIYRRAKSKDYQELLNVASAYYRDNPALDKSQGFLNNQLTEDIFQAVNEHLGLLVAEKDEKLLGFLGIVPYSDRFPSPVMQALFSVLPHIKYKNKAIATLKPFFFGPICIAPQATGLGLFKGLYRAMWAFLPFDKYQCGIAFVDKQNQRSLDAHVKGLGAEVIGEFSLKDDNFWIIAYSREAAKNIALD